MKKSRLTKVIAVILALTISFSAFGAVTAGACDGGSSSVLAYNGEIINKPSTPMTTGRYLPNAFLVKKK